MFSSLILKLEARSRAGYICFLLVYLAGCVPTISTLFVPVAPNAQALDARCPPEPGTVARFYQAGVFVSIRAYPGSGGNFGMQLAFEVPEGKIVEFQDEKVYLHTGAEVLPFQVRATSGPWYLPMNGASIPQEDIGTRGWGTIYDPLPGTVGARLGVARTDSKVFEFTVWGPARVGDNFSIQLPSFAVNGTSVAPLSIPFRSARYFAFAPINC